MVTIADCRKRIQLEFFIGTKRTRRMSLAKINLMIDILTAFRDTLSKEIALVQDLRRNAGRWRAVAGNI